MILLCALNRALEFFRFCKRSWLVLVALVLTTFTQDLTAQFFKAYLLKFNFTNLTKEKVINTLFSHILTQFNPTLLIHLYLLLVLTILVFGFTENKNINLKEIMKLAFRKYPQLLISTILYVLFILFVWTSFAIFTLELKLVGLNITGTTGFMIAIVAIIPATYLSVRLSLYYCYVIDGRGLNSFKMSWKATKNTWLDLLIIGLALSILNHLFIVSYLLSRIFSTITIAFMLVIFTFMYFQVKK